jgi:polar amino acid transport system permease protein
MFELLELLSFDDTGWGDELLKGLGVTLSLALVTAPLALVGSFLIAWSKEAPNKIVRMAGQAFTTLFRSLPELLTLLIIYYQLQGFVDYIGSVLFDGNSISISPFMAGAFALALVFSALGSEVVRGAYRAVGKDQLEGAYSIGLSPRKAFFLVILPQMWRHMLPAFGNLWLLLLKDTSLVSIIALSEVVRYANMAIATTKEPFFFYAVIALIYVVLAFISGLLQTRMEKRVSLTIVEEN